MPKSFRIRTQPGVDKSIKIKLEQDFDFLEILSLKILQSDVYTRVCSDYGVVVGRVLVNGGFGVPNAKVSVFIPLSDEDQNNPVISDLYPYRSVDDVNEDGYRYNLLPYEPSYTTHAATGTFPSREDVLTNAPLVEVYDKYYKFTVKTNESGDYMIFGVPTGLQTIFMDVDLSDIGCFSLSPQDLIDTGRATESQVNGNKFKSSNNLRELPQIVTLNKNVEVQPLWGEPEICLLGITRVDFDLTGSASINIQPTSVFMGSIVSTTNEDSVKRNCKPKTDTGNLCDLVAGPGQILAIRQTINTDVNGDPILEEYVLEEDGKVIDGAGTWLVNIPMNLDYITTNEFGEQVLSNDPNIGIPTKGKYRFRIRWQNEEGLRNNFMRADFLVPNIKEHGWVGGGAVDPTSLNETNYDFQIPVGLTATTLTIPEGGLVFSNAVNNLGDISLVINGVPYTGNIESVPLPNPFNTVEVNSIPLDNTQPQTIIFTQYPQQYFDVIRSYAFSLDWDDYVDKQDAVDCEDTFYEFNYNKIYTISSFIDRYKNGKNRQRHLGIKEITDRACQSENNKFPVNDLERNFDFLFFIVSLFSGILTLVIIPLLGVLHFISLTWPVIKWVFIIGIPLLLVYLATLAALTAAAGAPAFGIMAANALYSVLYVSLGVLFSVYVIPKLLQVKKIARLALPMLSYPDCEGCPCETKDNDYDEINDAGEPVQQDVNTSFLGNTSISGSFVGANGSQLDNLPPTYVEIQNDNPEVLSESVTGYLEMFSGIDDTASPTRRGVGSFITKKTGGSDKYGYPLTETWSQKLNSFNLRDKYFNNVNRVETRINGSAPILDQVFVAVVDWGIQNTFNTGELITFQNPILSGDIERLTGSTLNEFGNFSITGVTSTGSSTFNMYYADPNDPTWSTNLSVPVTINQTNNNGSYRFPADMEYFQVITGMSWTEFVNTPGINSTTNYLFPREYLLHLIKYRYDDYPGGVTPVEEIRQALYEFTNYQDLGLVFFVRGVDPYTEKQTVEYNLTRIFGGQIGVGTQVTVQGQYYINYPIRGYSNGKKPIEHINPSYNNTPFTSPTQRSLYGRSFTFTPDQTLMNTIPNNQSILPYYYLSTDSNNSGLDTIANANSPSFPSYFSTPGQPIMTNLINSNNNLDTTQDFVRCRMLPYNNMSTTQLYTATPYTYPPSPYGYYVGGGAFLFASILPNYDLPICATNNNFDNQPIWYLYSPSYRMYVSQGIIPGINFNNNLGMVMRSDRLPTSSKLESNGQLFTSFAFMENNSFVYYRIPDDGLSLALDTFSLGQDVSSGNLADADVSTGLTSSLSCENMTSLECYTGYGTGFTVNPNCPQGTKVEGGCYYLLNRPYMLELGNDIDLFLEWKARFLVMFAACRGVFSHMFQNNWINGTLYMPSFNKQTTFNILGQPRYNYCDDIVFYNDVTNSFFYRSSPWNGTLFVGAPKPVATNLLQIGQQPDDSANDRQILFPTTIMDMGKRDEFISEICSNPVFDGRYLGDSFMSTSYNDSSDILQLSIISRLVNATWGQQMWQTGAASVNQFFSRTGQRIDGDIAQSFSINSEYQINPFITGNYADNQIFVGQDNTGPIFGVFYNATGVTNNSQYRNRRGLSPGVNIYSFSPPLQQSYGYPKSQYIPLYKWKIESNGLIFGNENNNWVTTANGGFYTERYQELDAINNDYFKTALMTQSFPNIYYGFITNYDNAGNPVPGPIPSQSPIINPIIVGAPYHFYFGLKNGNTALNRFIKKYIETAEQ